MTTRPIAGRVFCFPSDAFAWLTCVDYAPNGSATFVTDSGEAVTLGHARYADMVEVGPGIARDLALAKAVEWLWAHRSTARRSA